MSGNQDAEIDFFPRFDKILFRKPVQ